MTTIVNRLQAIKEKIRLAEQTFGRTPNSVKLLAVSKAQTAHAIREAYHAGQNEFGENYLQEALTKQSELNDLPLVWHFIGPIQSNKTQLIAQHFDWVHGVDRLKIAERLNQSRATSKTPLNICIQVNVSEEDSKSGVSPQELLPLAEAIQQMPHLVLRGLMAIPAPAPDETTQRAQFATLRRHFDALNAKQFNLDTLSMGMSDDFVSAIAEQSTLVRIGSAIFGARPQKSTTQPTENA